MGRALQATARETQPNGAMSSWADSDRVASPAVDQDHQNFSPLPLIVRAVRLADVPTLPRFPMVLRLNQPEHSLGATSPTRAAISQILRWRDTKPRVFVAKAGGRTVGFAQWQPVLPDRRWQLIALGAATGVFDAAPVWEELIRHSTTAAGLNGVKRLDAKIPLLSPVEAPIRSAGFTAYASETIFLARQAETGSSPVLLRNQEQTDTWAIHQLYNATVPKKVQFAEAWTSHHWDVRTARTAPNQITRGWLAEDGHQLLGYVRATSHGSTHVLELIYTSEEPGIVARLLDGATARLRRFSRLGAVYIAVRGYQAEAVSALMERGFDPLIEQDLHVKYTTAVARQPQPEIVPFHADVIERLPKRVPSFLHGKHGDGTAS